MARNHLLSNDKGAKQSQVLRLGQERLGIVLQRCYLDWWNIGATRISLLFSLLQKRMKPRYKPCPKHPIKVHVWAGISWWGATGISIFEGIINTPMYTNILDQYLIPFICDVYHSSHKIMQDNDPKHTYILTCKGIVCRKESELVANSTGKFRHQYNWEFLAWAKGAYTYIHITHQIIMYYKYFTGFHLKREKTAAKIRAYRWYTAFLENSDTVKILQVYITPEEGNSCNNTSGWWRYRILRQCTNNWMY